jgi:hypothetical protein
MQAGGCACGTASSTMISRTAGSDTDDEPAGIDEAEHAETGYDLGRVGAHITTAAARAVHGPPATAPRSGSARGPASLEAC